MAVPKKKISNMRRKNRRSHDSISGSAIQACPDTGDLKLRHHVSPDGWYKGRQIVKAKEKSAEEASAE